MVKNRKILPVARQNYFVKVSSKSYSHIPLCLDCIASINSERPKNLQIEKGTQEPCQNCGKLPNKEINVKDE